MRISVLLPAFLLSVAAAAQPRAEFAELQHDFGRIVWHNGAQAVFKVRNAGNQPLQITDVRPDCGCTLASWTTTPIAAGKEGLIAVDYDAELLGHFTKGLAVFTNAAERPVYLTLTGVVVMEDATPVVELPVKMGDISLSTDNLEFDDVNRGDCPVRTISVHNGSTHSVQPHLMHLPKYLTATAIPQTLHPGRTGQIQVQLNSAEIRNMGLTQSAVYFSGTPGEKLRTENELAVSVTLLPDVRYSENTLAYAPVAQIDTTAVNLGSLGNRKRVKTSLLLTNAGRLPLTIDALQVYNPGLSVSVNTRTIKPGESAKIKIAVSNLAHNFKGRRRILLITNDPRRPKLVIDVEVKK